MFLNLRLRERAQRNDLDSVPARILNRAFDQGYADTHAAERFRNAGMVDDDALRDAG